MRLIEDGRSIALGPLQTPISVLSDGADRLIGLFQRSEPAACSADDRGDCPADFECDTGLGTCTGFFPVPCLPGAAAGEEGACAGTSECVEMGGYCRDPLTSIDDGGTTGRMLSVAQRLRVGVEAEPGSSEFIVTPWVTNKLMNSFARAVSDFDEARPHGQGNDYRAPSGEQLESAPILIGGRPSYIGAKAPAFAVPGGLRAVRLAVRSERRRVLDDAARRRRGHLLERLDLEPVPGRADENAASSVTADSGSARA